MFGTNYSDQPGAAIFTTIDWVGICFLATHQVCFILSAYIVQCFVFTIIHGKTGWFTVRQINGKQIQDW